LLVTLKGLFRHIGLAILRLAKYTAMGTALCAATAPLVSSRIPTTLERVQQAGELVVISRNGPTTYYEDAQGTTGFEYVMAKRFANYLGVELRIEEMEDLGRMVKTVGRNNTHLAAAGLTITPGRKESVLFTEPYMEVTQQLIYRQSTPRPQSIEDLIGKRILVIANSSHAERLRQLQREYPGLTWEERYDVEMLDLLEMVHHGKIDYTIVDSNAYQINSALYPEAQIAFNISEPEGLAWAFPQSKDDSLYRAANEFIKQTKSDGTLAAIEERFYGHVGELDYSGALLFARRLQERLPKWEDYLKEAAASVNVDWQLLAALSYQESHWNPTAKSYTGVRGFMMLTQTTAKEMRINNRLDPEQSIDGGSRYFRKIMDRLPERIQGPDRIWLALAAYNIGMGHLEDARILTQHYGDNPDKWTDVKKYLPLLAKRNYYKHTKHGYARGWEAVTYVQNIRNYYAIIAWHELEQQRLTQVAMSEPAQPSPDFSPVVSQALETLASESL
jgi:membrane-bound lytic murein transglycosylase F